MAKHPMLLATKFWATAHLLAKGTLADVLLFGGLLARAVADGTSRQMQHRPPRRIGFRACRRDHTTIVMVLIVGLPVYARFIQWAHR